MTEENYNDDILRKKLLQQLEVEVGLPLIPKSAKELERDFQGSEILLSHYPIKDIKELKIDGKIIDLEDSIILEDEGAIHLPKEYSGVLYVEYAYGIPEDKFLPILDLMVEYETDTSLTRDVSSITEGKRSINYDTSKSKGAQIQSMIENLKSRYGCVVRLI